MSYMVFLYLETNICFCEGTPRNGGLNIVLLKGVLANAKHGNVKVGNYVIKLSIYSEKNFRKTKY